MTSPCSALLLTPLLLLLLASSANEQVRVMCVLSGAADLVRSRRAAIAKVSRTQAQTRFLGPDTASARDVVPRPTSLAVAVAVGVAAMQCVAMLVLSAQLHEEYDRVY
jgi:Ni/Fe-hydrogenase subunit HybB-like protein